MQQKLHHFLFYRIFPQVIYYGIWCQLKARAQCLILTMYLIIKINLLYMSAFLLNKLFIHLLINQNVFKRYYWPDTVLCATYQHRNKNGRDQLSLELQEGWAFSRVDIWEGFQSTGRSLPGSAFHGREAALTRTGSISWGGKIVRGRGKLGFKLSYMKKIPNIH